MGDVVELGYEVGEVSKTVTIEMSTKRRRSVSVGHRNHVFFFNLLCLLGINCILGL